MKIIVDNQLIEYRDEGSGKVLVLMHGWGTDLATFDVLAKHLAQHFRVIRFDFPGFGQSQMPVGDWTVDDYANLTAGLLTKLKIDNLYAVIGHSFGGRIIVKGVSDGKLNPEKVVLIGSAGVKPRKSIKHHVYRAVAKTGKAITALPGIKKVQPILRSKLYKSIGNTDYLESGAMKKVFLNTINEDLLPHVKNINQPTLLIWGRNDTETPFRDAETMLESLQNGELDAIDDAGHFVYLEAPENVIKDLDRFLS
ncbi:alpha/beta hydrolase [Candidatus Saccharibacteria bacterium]|nr:alpha/beta hydrolase [Candidatus Saccharibacteria bacterium]